MDKNVENFFENDSTAKNVKEDEVVVEMPNGKIKDKRLDGISDQNKILACGAIVHKHNTAKSCYLTIMVRGGHKLDKFNFPQFIFSNELKEVADAYQTGDHVQIEGVATSMRNRDGETYNNALLGLSVERTKSRLAELTLESELGAIRKLPTAEFFVAGTVYFMEVQNDCVHLLIKTVVDNRTYYANYYHYPRNLAKVINDVKKGNRICACGEIQTKKIEQEGQKTIYIQRNVITDIGEIDSILSLK